MYECAIDRAYSIPFIPQDYSGKYVSKKNECECFKFAH